MTVDVIIPVLNEQNAVGLVIDDIPKALVRNIIVVDNGSVDDTPIVAEEKGAIVLHESQQGYGKACLKGIDFIKSQDEKPDAVVFLDGDYSDYPEHMTELIKEIKSGSELVIGSRALGDMESGAMTVPQVFGNWLATRMISVFYGYKFTDLGPFRAVRFDSLLKMNMKDENFGWTVEMQVKATKLKMNTTEIPVNYRNRIGTSKISGTVKGTILAGHKIITTILKEIW
ncbi:glycosyltransferase family 2 protein [Reichenbachiella versicolor]|uniref:glycosyltransferase family 2 protein n=1 Tax=Reichenbachiella versicolor TaxID=1821036 RepID=UPI000D6DC63D|nr:glycosyltransferase family 2 protein [Reichenbachiella versicolor]